jgi:hypothetical protein
MIGVRLASGLLLCELLARASGLYAVWYSNSPGTLSLPYLSGSQVVVNWGSLQTGPSTYDWTPLDSAMAAETRIFTVQVNGAMKPAFLFNLVPRTPNWGNTQAGDPLGILMYWHPVYMGAYTNFLAALASHLSASPYRSNILGLRMNFNAVGTEQIDVPAANRRASTWIVPPGASNGPDWTAEISQNYEKTVIDAHIAGFGAIPVFARITLDPAILTQQATDQPGGFTYADYFKQSKLGLLYTGGAPEIPLFQSVATLYAMYVDYLEPGLTVGYTEPVSDAWGVAGNPASPLPHWSTPPQWNYWRLLSDLALGVSDIALYGEDLTVALAATHLGRNVGSDYQLEFDQAFQFAARHAGYHADPQNAPGAWIAFRESITNYPRSAYRQLTDYKRFLTLLNPQNTVGLDARRDGVAVPLVANRTAVNEQSIGPYNSRFGAWARSLPAGATAELQLDSNFADSVNNLSGATIGITYLDDVANASFITTFGVQSVTTTLGASGQWQTVTIPVTSAFAQDSSGGHIAIQTIGAAITFHMVDVEKNGIQ